MSDSNRALEGVTVVALEHAVAAPLATRQLADLGARVIKVERPGVGDFARGYDRRARGLSSHFVWCNRGKQSLTLDLKRPAAAALLRRLVLEQADVLVQNLAPGATDRLGLSHAALAPHKPSLIVCDISGYGADGPDRDRKAYDLLIQSEAGFLSVTGQPDAPAKAGVAIADIAAGVTAHARILAALLQRHRSGRGRRIDVSMLESLAEWMGFPLYYAIDGSDAPPRRGAGHATIVPYGPFATGDGAQTMLGVQNEREWRAFCTVVLEQPALADDPRFDGNANRDRHRDALHAIIEATFAALDAAALRTRLDAAKIANAQVRDMAGLWAHPQLAARGRWRDTPSPVGPIPGWLPAGFDADELPDGEGVPALGQHTEPILRELGLDDGAIAALRADGSV